MLSRIKRLPVTLLVLITLALLYPSYVMWDHSLLKARAENNCLDPRKELPDCYLDYYEDVSEKQGSIVALKELHERKETESRAAALQAMLEPIKSVDWRTLIAVNANMDSKLMMSLAFQQLAENAEKIGELNISPDLLNTLLRTSRDSSK